MGITVHIRYRGHNGNARKFAEEMVSSGIVREIRSREGNVKYEYYFSMDDPEMILLIDQWQDQKALDLHHQSPMMKEIIRLREKYDLHMIVERFLADEKGIPETDAAFIRK